VDIRIHNCASLATSILVPKTSTKKVIPIGVRPIRAQNHATNRKVCELKISNLNVDALSFMKEIATNWHAHTGLPSVACK
jgi:hypothetical protein